MEENEKIKKAVLICHELTGSARAKRVRELNEKWRKDFLTEEYNRGEEIGEVRGKGEIIKKLLKSGMRIEAISNLIDIPICEIERIKSV